MFNFFVKNTTDLLFGRRLWSALGSILVSRSQKRYNRPVFSVSKLHNFSRQYHYLFKFRGLIRRYIVPYYLLKKSLLLPTYFEIRGLVGSQNGTNIHMSVPKSLQYLPTNLYTSVVDFIYFRRLVESPLYFARPL